MQIIDIGFVALYLGIPCLWYLLLHCAGLSLFQFSIPSFVITTFFILQYMGLPILFFQLDEYRVVSGVTDQYLVLEVAFYNVLTISLMISGFVFASLLLGRLKKNFSCKMRLNLPSNMFLGFLFLLCTVIFVRYLQRVPSIALLETIYQSSQTDIAAARSGMSNAFEGKYHWYFLFINKLMLFVLFVYYAQMLATPTIRSKLCFFLVFLVASASMIVATVKSPFIFMIIGLFLVHTIIRCDGKIAFGKIATLGLGLLIIATMFYRFFMGSESFFEGVKNVVSRAICGQIQPAYHYLEFFPRHKEFLYGLSFPNPGHLLPYDPYPLTTEISAWKHPEARSANIVGSMPTIFWGEMYANFGLWGVVLPPAWVGFYLYILNFALFRFGGSPALVGLLTWIALHYQALAGVSLTHFMYDTYLLVVFLSFIGLHQTAKFGFPCVFR